MSEIRVNNIIADNGLDAVNFAKGINVSSGIITATSFSGSGASLTSLPAANLTGTLPAISGANLTGITAGITQADIYRLNTSLSLSYDTVTVITANWERPDQSDDVFDKIGTGMSQSSGIFTFPTTGIYLVTYIARLYATTVSYANHIYMDATVNNSSYVTVAQSANNIIANGQTTTVAQSLLDITDTSNRKVRFKVYAAANNQQLLGNSNKQETFVTFIRLGDT